jgi:hypothetical protein
MRACKFAFAALLFAPWFVQPSSAYGTWGIGPLGGANLSNADIGGQTSHGVVGWAVGARLEMGMNPLLSLSLDPMFVSHTVEFDPAGGAFAGRGEFHFLEVPLFLKARLGLAGIAVNAFAGPNLTMLYDVTGRFSADHELTSADFQPVSLSGDVGLGFAFNVAPFVEITTDARYSHGITDIMNHQLGNVDHWRSRDVRMVVGVLLNTGR